MSGPKDALIDVPAVKWWLAISRGVLVTGARRRAVRPRRPATCERFPAFASPLKKHTGTSA